METYSIICKTDLYNANRHSGFDRNGEKVIESGLTLREAQKALLKRFSDAVDKYVPNWGVAVSMSTLGLEAKRTFSDGTRCYEDDIFTYWIRREENEDEE